MGRGLEVLIGGGASSTELLQIPLGSIRTNTRQPRKHIDAESIGGLADSVRAQGVMQPVVVRSAEGGEYELIAGERRWRAARAAGLATIPAVVRETDDRESLVLALVENVARENLSPIEEARAYAVLMDEFALSLGEVAERVGRSKPTVSNRVRLLELPEDVLGLVERGLLMEGHARAILSVPGHDDRRALARKVVAQGLSVRATERAARWAGAQTKPRRSRRVDPTLAERARNVLEGMTGATVKVTDTRVEIPFADEVALAELVESLETVAGS